MILQVYSVYDKAVSAYLQPFYARSRGEAIRSFMEACNDEKHQFQRNAADYVLMYIGVWNDDNGMFDGLTTGPETVLSALEATADRSQRQ